LGINGQKNGDNQPRNREEKAVEVQRFQEGARGCSGQSLRPNRQPQVGESIRKKETLIMKKESHGDRARTKAKTINAQKKRNRQGVRRNEIAADRIKSSNEAAWD